MPENNTPINLDDMDRAPVVLEQPGPMSPEALEAFRRKWVELGEENGRLRIEIESLKKKINTTIILDKLIEPYASRTYWFMVAYCAFAGLVLVLTAIEDVAFKLQEDVLKLLVGSTAVTVIGLVGMVLTGIFVGARK